MEQLVSFFSSYGPICCLIAIAGIIVLGVLKYCNLFSKYDEQTRHWIYLVISVGLTVLGTFIYELCIGQFDAPTFFTCCGAIYALNQAFYNIFKITPVNKIAGQLLTKILELFGVDKTDFEESAQLGDARVIEIDGQPIDFDEEDDEVNTDDNPEA